MLGGPLLGMKLNLKGFKLISAGPDKKFGTSDDIVEKYRRKW